MKTFITSIVLCLFLVLNASAQITTSWTSKQPSDQIPTGATNPTISKLTDPRKEFFSFDLDGATYDNAVATTGWTAIGNATKTEVDSTFIPDVLGLDTSYTITGRIYITDITRRFDNFEPSDKKNIYLEATNIYRVIGYLEWLVTP